ncbi:MAG: hypothetical protein ACRCXT_00110, partial [Paraclostridium sp.]
MKNYQIDTKDISRFNLLKVNEYINEVQKELRNPTIDKIIKDDLESILVRLINDRDFIQDMRYEKSH